MARSAYSLAVPARVLEGGYSIMLVPVRDAELPTLSQITAPRGFLPETCASQPSETASGAQGMSVPAMFAAPRGFLPGFSV